MARWAACHSASEPAYQQTTLSPGVAKPTVCDGEGQRSQGPNSVRPASLGVRPPLLPSLSLRTTGFSTRGTAWTEALVAPKTPLSSICAERESPAPGGGRDRVTCLTSQGPQVT